MSQLQARSRTRLLGAGLTAGALGAALLVAPEAAFAAPTMVGPPIVSVGGSATINDPAGIFSANSTVQMASSTCAGRPAAPTANGPWGATVGTKTTMAVSFTVPTGPTAGPNGTVRPYTVCVYDSANINTATPSLQGSAVVFVGAPVALSANSGITGGGNQLTANGGATPIFTGINTVSAVFTATGSCPATQSNTNPANLVVPNAVRQSNTSVSLAVPPGVVAANGAAPTMYTVCLYDGSVSGGNLLSFANYTVTTVGLSPASGSYLSSNGVTATSPLPFLSGVTTPAVLVLPGMGPACPAIYSPVPIGAVTPLVIGAPGAVRRLSNNRAAVTIPPLPLTASQPTQYQLCFYGNNSATGALVGTSTFTAAVIANPAGVFPTAGPAAGGNSVTVVGTDFPTDPGRITATLGGAQLTNIQPISDKAFTAQVPAHAVEDNVTLVVSTPSGTKALPGAYSYLNPIKVSPNSAPSTSPYVDVDVQGMGFMALNFGTTGSAARVFLVNGVYNGADAGAGVRANGQVAECVNVLPIADDELICTLQLNRRLNNTGGFFDSVGYTNTLTTDVSTTAGSRIITSTGGKFSANDIGQPIAQTSNTNIPLGSIVTSVLSPAKAVISMPAPAIGTNFTAVVGNAPVHSFTAALTTTNGSTAVTTSATGAFSRADIGRVFGTNTPGVTVGTTIVAVAPGGASATLSAPASVSTQYPLVAASIADGTPTLNSTNLVAGDAGSVIGANSLGIPPGTTISTVTGTSATLSANAVGGGTGATITLNKPVNGALYAAAPVPDGSYNLVVVSNGAPDAVNTDPDYDQTDVTSSSTFTVASF